MVDFYRHEPIEPEVKLIVLMHPKASVDQFGLGAVAIQDCRAVSMSKNRLVRISFEEAYLLDLAKTQESIAAMAAIAAENSCRRAINCSVLEDGVLSRERPNITLPTMSPEESVAVDRHRPRSGHWPPRQGRPELSPRFMTLEQIGQLTVSGESVPLTGRPIRDTANRGHRLSLGLSSTAPRPKLHR